MRQHVLGFGAQPVLHSLLVPWPDGVWVEWPGRCVGYFGGWRVLHVPAPREEETGMCVLWLALTVRPRPPNDQSARFPADLQRMYVLFERVPEGHAQLCERVKAFVCGKCKGLSSANAGASARARAHTRARRRTHAPPHAHTRARRRTYAPHAHMH